MRKFIASNAQIFQRLEIDPLVSGDIQKVKSEVDTYRYRVGDYRIIYSIDHKEKINYPYNT